MIGLLTPYDVMNYGTKLQAYAMQRFVGAYDTVEILSYRPGFADKLLHKYEKEQNKRYADVRHPQGASNGVDELSVLARQDAIARFDSLLPIGPEMVGSAALRQHARQFDTLVCGSDQIWHPVNLHAHYYMLEFAPPGVNTIALSPSFGVGALPAHLERTYARRLAHVNHLSVREDTGVAILRRLGFDKVTWTLDPTLMLDERDWADLGSTSGMELPSRPYIFCYFLGFDASGRNLARELRQMSGCDIVSLPHFKGYCEHDVDFADHNLYDVLVSDFIRLIHGASFVCTDSFHASVLSLLLKKRVICCKRHVSGDVASTNSRITSLFSRLGIEAPLPRDRKDLDRILNTSIDYAELESRLLCERNRTRWYFENALQGRSS